MTLKSSPFVYNQIGFGYRQNRKPDHRLAAQIREGLGDSITVCNVGAGTGSYEPTDLQVTAVEPSERMIEQRINQFPVVKANAESLPFDDKSFDAAMAVLTIHHWVDPEKGLSELKRISKRQVILTFDVELIESLWLVKDYFPEIAAFERSRAVPMETVVNSLDHCEVRTLPIPWDCTDGFQAAFWRRPEAYLDPMIRSSISTFAQLPEDIVQKGIKRLADDIASGSWADRYSGIAGRTEMDFGYRLVVANNHDVG